MAAYPQRTDLNKMAPTAATGQTYGAAGAQIAAQKAVPMGSTPTAAMPQIQRPTPGAAGPLDRPTERPQEPITSGAPFGAGPGQEIMPRSVMPEPGSNLDMAERLRAIIAVHPNPNLIALLSSLEAK